MIVIKTDEYEMVQSSKTGPFFNFSVLATINAGKDTERKEMKLIAYGLPFETCMQQIVAIEMHKQKDSTSPMTVHAYIERYRLAVEKVSKLITYVEKVVEPKEEING